MSDLLKRLYEAEQASVTPDDGARERHWADLQGALKAGAQPIDNVPVPEPVSWVARWPWAAGGLAALVAAPLVGLAVYGSPSGSTPGVGSQAGLQVAPRQGEPARGPQGAAGISATPPAIGTAAVDEAASSVVPSVAPARHATRPITDSAASQARTKRTRRPEPPEELELLAKAQRALARKAWKSVARIVARHARLYPEGKYAQEREAVRVAMLCDSGDGERGRRALERFKRRFPESLQLDRLFATCNPATKP